MLQERVGEQIAESEVQSCNVIDSEEMACELVLEGRADYCLAGKKKSGSSGKCDSVTTVPGLGGPGVSHLPGAEAFASTCSYERTLKDI